MKNVVILRDFEERDIDSIYKWKNDEKLNNMTVGEFRQFSYEDAIRWVQGCMGNHEHYKFWAVCTNDEKKRIVGYVSLSNVNISDGFAEFGGIMIGEHEYQGGVAWIQIYQLVLEYVFEILSVDILRGRAITEHPQTVVMMDSLFFNIYKVEQNVVFKNGRYYDVQSHALLKKDYFEHKANGDYTFSSIMKRISKHLIKKG